MKRNLTVLLVVLASAALLATPVLGARSYRGPALWKNCTHVHKKYPHGVGKLHAHDKTKGTPVTNFKRSTRLYKLAMRYNNKRLDADKDGIACERK
jgi:hypothetical protein